MCCSALVPTCSLPSAYQRLQFEQIDQLHVHIGQKGLNNYNPKSHKSYVVVPGLSYAR